METIKEAQKILKKTDEWLDIINLPQKFKDIEARMEALEKYADETICPICRNGRLMREQGNDERIIWICDSCNGRVKQYRMGKDGTGDWTRLGY